MPFWSRRYLPATAPRFMSTAMKRKSFYVLEGQFEITIGDQKVTALSGAMVVGPRDVPHTFRNTGSKDGRLLLTVIPGRFANYFIDVDGMDDDDMASIQALIAKYDVEILE
jgi:hypothetical protein